jgi:hypothetical protein
MVFWRKADGYKTRVLQPKTAQGYQPSLGCSGLFWKLLCIQEADDAMTQHMWYLVCKTTWTSRENQVQKPRFSKGNPTLP